MVTMLIDMCKNSTGLDTPTCRNCALAFKVLSLDKVRTQPAVLIACSNSSCEYIALLITQSVLYV
jgi:hypothetical protein